MFDFSENLMLNQMNLVAISQTYKKRSKIKKNKKTAAGKRISLLSVFEELIHFYYLFFDIFCKFLSKKTYG